MPRALRTLHDKFVAVQRYAGQRAPATLRGYQQAFATLQHLVPTVTLQTLSPDLLAEFFRRLDTRKRHVGHGLERQGVRNSTMATYRGKLGPFFRWLEAGGHLTSNPLAGLPQLRVEYEQRVYLDRSAVERIFASLALAPKFHGRLLRRRNLALFALLAYTGLRRGELLNLRLTDLNLGRYELTVRGETSKSRRTRIIPLHSTAAAAIEDYLAVLRMRQPVSEYLFPRPRGSGPFTVDGLKHLVAEVSRRSGVRFHVHQFRHTFAVNFLNRGGDVVRLKQILGHRDIRVTTGYLRSLPTSALRAEVEGMSLEALL